MPVKHVVITVVAIAEFSTTIVNRPENKHLMAFVLVDLVNYSSSE